MTFPTIEDIKHSIETLEMGYNDGGWDLFFTRDQILLGLNEKLFDIADNGDIMYLGRKVKPYKELKENGI